MLAASLGDGGGDGWGGVFPVLLPGAARRGTRGMFPGMSGGARGCPAPAPHPTGVAAPGCARGKRRRGDAAWGMPPGMLGGTLPGGARGMLGGCSGGAHRLAGGMSGGCPGLLEGWPGGGRPAARPALRSAPRAAAGGAAGPEGGSGAGRGWRLQPGSPAGQAPLTRLLCKWSSPVPPASLTSSPPAGRKGKEGGMGWGGVPRTPCPRGEGAGTRLAVPPSLAPTGRGPCCHPLAGWHPGRARVGTAGGAVLATSQPLGHPPAMSVHPRVLILGCQGGCKVGRDGGGRQGEPRRLQVRGWARGWHGAAWGGGHAHSYTRTHTQRSGNIKLHCR